MQRLSKQRINRRNSLATLFWWVAVIGLVFTMSSLGAESKDQVDKSDAVSEDKSNSISEDMVDDSVKAKSPDDDSTSDANTDSEPGTESQAVSKNDVKAIIQRTKVVRKWPSGSVRLNRDRASNVVVYAGRGLQDMYQRIEYPRTSTPVK